MAFEVKRIDPIDFKKVGVGVSIPFNAPGVFNVTYATKDQLKSNLINFFLTNPGERFFNPSFGGNLRRSLFEQITDGSLEDIKSNIEQATARNFPNIVIGEVKVLGKPDQNDIFISVKYSIPNTNISDELQINFS